MNKKNIFGGIILILLAIIIAGTAMGFIPDIPWFKLACTVVFAAFAIKGLFKREFFGSIMSLCIIAWLYETELGIADITPWPLFLAGAFLGIGLGMIFKKKRKIITFNIQDGEGWRVADMDEVREKCNSWTSGRDVVLENVFSSVSKYVNEEEFRSANIENVFGNATVYFNNANIGGNYATINIENVFGQSNIYLPKTWRVHVNEDAVFGKVNIFGDANYDMDAPEVEVKAESVFGVVNIYME